MDAEQIYRRVQELKPQIRRWSRPYETEADDLCQDIVVHLLSQAQHSVVSARMIRMAAFAAATKYVRDRRNRERLESEHSDEILRNNTPTLSGQGSGPEQEVDMEQILRARWLALSPLLQKVARRSFFGYAESPEKIARELGMTVAAVNMARTRIKQHMNGAKDGE